jgi:hypothetical protein
MKFLVVKPTSQLPTPENPVKSSGKRFSAFNLFKVRERFPADWRRLQRRLAQIFISTPSPTLNFKP